MIPRIHVLPPLLANQIAAGEVVERPASVIKELLENSLDAGAQKIEIDIENGGVDLIRIRDDGHGIEKDDLALALSRHATSKILSEENLREIKSLGFRGEALASIAAVSRLNLISKTANAEHAWKISSDPALNNTQIEAAAHPLGTTIEVRDLFYNVPARRKFLKSERTELTHIENTIHQLVLSRPNFTLTLRHQQKVLLQVKAASQLEQMEKRIAAICSISLLKQAVYLDNSDNNLRLYGWAGLPTAARSQTDMQYFFVNGRVVRDKLLNHAIKLAYQDLLYEGKHPAYVLYLELPHELVDVNVHPTKHEVRFYESRHVHDFIAFHLQKSLQVSNQTALTDNIRMIEQPALVDAEDNFLAAQGSPISHAFNKPFIASNTQNNWTKLVAQESVPSYVVNNVEERPAKSVTTAASVLTPSKTAKTLGDFVGLIKPTATHATPYLLFQQDDGILVINFLRAQQVLAYEALVKVNESMPLIGQPLLLPPSLTFTAENSDKLDGLLNTLALYGIKMSRMGESRWLVRELPAVLKNIDIEKVITILLQLPEVVRAPESLSKIFAEHIQLEKEEKALENKLLEFIIKLNAISQLKQHWLAPCRLIAWKDIITLE